MSGADVIRPRDFLGAVLVCWVAVCAPAFGDIRALGVHGVGPVFSGDQVVWSAGSSVLSAPVAGGAATRLSSVPGVSALAASGSSLAVVAGHALFVGGQRRAPRPGAPPFPPGGPPVAGAGAGGGAAEGGGG